VVCDSAEKLPRVLSQARNGLVRWIPRIRHLLTGRCTFAPLLRIKCLSAEAPRSAGRAATWSIHGGTVRLHRPARRRLSRFVSTGVIAVALVLVGTAVLSAHDFWIVPNAFAIDANGTMEVRGQTSVKFPTSGSAVTPDRVAEARLIAAASEERIGDLSVSGKSLLLRHRPTSAGQRVIAVALVTRTSRAAAAGLKRYIALEGAPELAERYERDGAFAKSDSVTQQITKYAKTLVEVGRGGPRAFSRVAGHALEFVPVTDPSALRVRDTLMVRLAFRGRPLASAHVHAGAAPEAAIDDSAALPKDWKDLSLETGPDGVARVPLDRPGVWNVRTLHAAPSANGQPGEWEVAFATIVFRAIATGSGAGRASSASRESNGDVPIPDTSATQASGDSTAVAAIVDRFHAAVVAGDSALALSLLAADAVVLESGGLETREEFRAHHLPADIAFAQAVKSERGSKRVVVRGDAAWVTSTSTTTGEYRGRQVNSSGAELMVLTRTPQGWRIASIHWSSRTRRPAGG
jgi:ketosteroid isomerase-like protein